MKIKVRVHQASFVDDMMKEPYNFINIRNNYKRRHITVYSIFFFAEGRDPILKEHKLTKWGYVLNEQRPLPVTIAPQTEWETWIKSSEMYPAKYDGVIVRLVNGKCILSKKRKDVAPSGEVPGSK